MTLREFIGVKGYNSMGAIGVFTTSALLFATFGYLGKTRMQHSRLNAAIYFSHAFFLCFERTEKRMTSSRHISILTWDRIKTTETIVPWDHGKQ